MLSVYLELGAALLYTYYHLIIITILLVGALIISTLRRNQGWERISNN